MVIVWSVEKGGRNSRRREKGSIVHAWSRPEERKWPRWLVERGEWVDGREPRVNQGDLLGPDVGEREKVRRDSDMMEQIRQYRVEKKRVGREREKEREKRKEGEERR